MKQQSILSHFLLLFIPLCGVFADEGMYPISEIHRLDLRAKGLLISAKDLYNPSGASLIDAIVNIGGCTGSFVSPDGLIITNHHCAFGAVQAISSREHDYVTDGFLARTRNEELQARGNTARITESYRDVSREVLSAVSDTAGLSARARAIEHRIKAIVAEAEKQNTGTRAEVSEMFAGKTYILFLYTYLRDVRLVYVPSRSIGDFGGENDNWIWPRHTGDFSFMRAYVAPDGSPAEYSPRNVPYHPKKYLRVQPAGADQGDPVFILGYPGRTFRHRTSHYLAYEENTRMPYVAGLYEWQIATMQKIGEADRAVALNHDARIKGLANTSKNYLGKLLGMKRLGLVARKRVEEKTLQAFIDADPQRRAAYGALLNNISAVYAAMEETAQYDLTLQYLRSSSVMLGAALTIRETARELQKSDLDRESAYMERNFGRTKDALLASLRNYYEATDRALLKEMLLRASCLPAQTRIGPIDAIMSGADPELGIDRFLDRAFEATRLNDESFVSARLKESPQELAGLKDPFLDLAASLEPLYQQARERSRQREGALSKFSAELVDVKQQYLKTEFIPDANSTLRFTYGTIRGYSPADAVQYAPITTMQGVVEKTTGNEPFKSPKKLLELHARKEFGRYALPRLDDVPVALLYDLDTTGGNSGSPLLNAHGELVGVNFDRTYEATVNDYAWNKDYSRSIAVDIRYVLWVTEKIGGAMEVLKEMGVQTSD